MIKILTRLATDESGATAIEYALIALGIGIAIIGGVAAVGGGLNTVFGTTLAGEF